MTSLLLVLMLLNAKLAIVIPVQPGALSQLFQVGLALPPTDAPKIGWSVVCALRNSPRYGTLREERVFDDFVKRRSLGRIGCKDLLDQVFDGG